MPSQYCTPAAFVLLVLVLGCDHTDPIASYTVPKHETIQIPVETPEKPTRPKLPPPRERTQPAGNLRMLAALVVKEDQVWTFKALAPPDTFPVDAAAKFDQLIETLKFENPNKPSWELGDGWTEMPGKGMRIANLLFEGLEFSVVRLGMPATDKAKYVLDNINRWRDQVGLPGIGMADMADGTRVVTTGDSREATVLDVRSPKGADDSEEKKSKASNLAAEIEPQDGPVIGKPPAEWQAERPGMMQLITYSVQSESGTAKVSVSQAGGPVLGNVNRWRGQIGLPPVTDEAELGLEDITVSGQPGLFAELYGEGAESIVIAMVPKSAPRWFFKIKGDTEAVKQQVAAFRTYLLSVEIRQ